MSDIECMLGHVAHEVNKIIDEIEAKKKRKKKGK